MHSGESVSHRKRKLGAMSPEPDGAVQVQDDPVLIKDFSPRSYQSEVYEVARKRNTIAVLETGAGKTMIAVMLIKDVYRGMLQSRHRRLIIYLAPTVCLVHQQYEVIKSHTSLKVGEYFGAKGVDDWSAESWEKEITEHDVLVMTPQILLDALRKAFVSMNVICMIILDECHRTVGNHPYAKIMKEFYHNYKDKPKIFGMTASPVIRKGVSSESDCEGQLSQLENILDSKIYIIEDRTELEQVVPTVQEDICWYPSSRVCTLGLIGQMESCWSKCDDALVKGEPSSESKYKDFDDKLKTLQKRLSTDHAKIVHCLNDLGLICALEAAKVCLENVSRSLDECELDRESSIPLKDYLHEVLELLECSMSQAAQIGNDTLSKLEHKHLEEIRLGLLSSKLHQLIQLFESFGDAAEVMCLIFVDRIIAAKVIERIIKRIKCLSHFTVSYLSGCNSSIDAVAPKVQKETLQSFRSGMVNLLFATDVVEEGIHVPNCSCVIRFDLPKTVRSYVQSRGRARQSSAKFILMVERGNKKQIDHVFSIIRSAASMKDTSAKRDLDTSVLKAHMNGEKDVYIVDSTGPSASADSSMSLLNRYCEKLPRDKDITPKPNFQMSMIEGMYQCEQTLPPNAPLQSVIGPVAKSSHLSKQLVCLEACKNLHQRGGFDDRLLPSIGKESEKIATVNEKGSSVSAAGTTKRKELHGTTSVHALSGCWGSNIDGAIFHSYRMDFSCSIVEEHYSGFVLLLETLLDDDVGSVQMDLYLHSDKRVTALVTPCGKVHLDSEQVTEAKRFQEFFFNGIFGKLFVGSKSSRELLFKSAGESLWKLSKMYLLLPLDSPTSSCKDSWKIDWAGVESTINVVQFLKKTSEMDIESEKENLIEENCLTGLDSDGSDIIHFANGLCKVENLGEKVVLATHTGRIYSIVEPLDDMNAESPFDGNGDTKSTPITFANYFENRYGIVLSYPNQPLLLLKQSHNAHNLLTNFNDEGIGEMKPQKPQIRIRMPPELLATVDVPRTVIKSIYLLPSLMYRLESLMLASQLRKEIAGHGTSVNISSSLILEALTTLGCCESFSLERLELLGDSVLKYAVSCTVFLKYPEKHEGQLSSQRQLAICNSTLHKLGINRNLQGYIRDSPFDPRRWLAPGQCSVREVPCSCGVDTIEVPLESKFLTEDPKIKIGLPCDKGHRWMCSKTVSDCVEALIGAYYVDGGLAGALDLMKWFGMVVDIDPSLVIEMKNSASLHTYSPRPDDIRILESKLSYEFSVKGLLVEAVTHASEQEVGIGYSYQRLEFLGDSVLDLLITWHLYQTHKDVDPGELTDLRSASVNNENFAQVAVRHQLYQHLQHDSGILQAQIEEFVRFLSCYDNDISSQHQKKGPKALGDLIESIAGAVLIDTQLNLDQVWRIYKALLSPIVTPDKLQLQPHRELTELCDSLGYFINETCTSKGDIVNAEIRLQLKDVLLVRQGTGKNRKTARGQAASYLLKDLEKQGISYSRFSSKRGSKVVTDNGGLSSMELDVNICSEAHSGLTATRPCIPPHTNGHVDKQPSSNPVIENINMSKGGPRSTLYQLCKKLQWPMPSFETTETNSRILLSFGEGPDQREGFNSFAAQITLHIPNFGDLIVMGEDRADKKSSYDSAAVLMLYKLEELGQVTIGGNSVPKEV